MKRMILLAVPMSVCNLRCSYCYLTHRDSCFENRQPKWPYTPEHVAKALSMERLGGPAYINVCADGETLLAKDIDKYIHELLVEGHYVEVITNLTITHVLDKILAFEPELLKRLFFKCSFHYLQLKEKKMLGKFSENINKIWESEASASVEITPHDELIPYIDELKGFSMENFGALPHVTIARNDDSENIEYLTKLDMNEYDEIWGSFDSAFWRFKKEIFLVKRNEFCYAGEWLLATNLDTGYTNQCYMGIKYQNIFEDIDNPIEFTPLGCCMQPHCYNGHSFLSCGVISNFTGNRYGDLRNRTTANGQWLKEGVLTFFNSTLNESNDEYSQDEQLKIIKKNKMLAKVYRQKENIKKIVPKSIIDQLKRRV